MSLISIRRVALLKSVSDRSFSLLEAWIMWCRLIARLGLFSERSFLASSAGAARASRFGGAPTGWNLWVFASIVSCLWLRFEVILDVLVLVFRHQLGRHLFFLSHHLHIILLLRVFLRAPIWNLPRSGLALRATGETSLSRLVSEVIGVAWYFLILLIYYSSWNWDTGRSALLERTVRSSHRYELRTCGLVLWSCVLSRSENRVELWR